jgi:phosphoglycolate phosphatase-like HAD superfamily hydrolase
MLFWKPPPFTEDNQPIEKLILFDIDGTLVLSGEVHRQSFQAAIHEIFDLDLNIDWKAHFGKTDPWILSEILLEAGIDQTEIDSKMESTLISMGDYYEAHKSEEQGEILPGVKELLEELQQRGILCGLVTGNVERIAYCKLSFYELSQYFALGGFGSDNSDRSQLILAAIEKAQDQFNFKYDGSNVIYVADTVHDVEAARKANVPIIIVLNWRNINDDFSIADPNLILSSMEDQGSFFNFVNNHKTENFHEKQE